MTVTPRTLLTLLPCLPFLALGASLPADGGGAPGQGFAASSAAPAPVAADRLAPGEVTVEANVSVTFELK